MTTVYVYLRLHLCQVLGDAVLWKVPRILNDLCLDCRNGQGHKVKSVKADKGDSGAKLKQKELRCCNSRDLPSSVHFLTTHLSRKGAPRYRVRCADSYALVVEINLDMRKSSILENLRGSNMLPIRRFVQPQETLTQ
jgi:hypothetical protein